MTQTRSATAREGDVSMEVTKMVAEIEDVDPHKLAPPLPEVIDIDALERLFTKDQTAGKVVFNYLGNEVMVFSDGYVSVSPTVHTHAR